LIIVGTSTYTGLILIILDQIADDTLWGMLAPIQVMKLLHTLVLSNFTHCDWNVEQGLISPKCLRAAFTRADPKSARRQSSHKCLFALL